VDNGVHPAEVALLNSWRVPPPSNWPILVDAFIANTLAPVLLRRVAAAGMHWPDHSRIRGGDFQEQEGMVADFIQDELARMGLELLTEGVPAEYDRSISSLAVYLTNFTRQHALTELRRIRGLGEVPLPEGERTHNGTEDPAISYRFSLVQHAKIRTRPIQMAGMQFQPRLDWQRAPAGELLQLLSAEVLVGGSDEGWRTLQKEHCDADARHREQETKLLDRRDHCKKAAVYESYLEKHDRMTLRYIFLPLLKHALVRLTNWEPDNVDQILKRYREALAAGEVVAIPAKKLELIRDLFGLAPADGSKNGQNEREPGAAT
jgi:hypothetical protein